MQGVERGRDHGECQVGLLARRQIYEIYDNVHTYIWLYDLFNLRRRFCEEMELTENSVTHMTYKTLS